jgi:C-terminal processing protease CtpA/Prc
MAKSGAKAATSTSARQKGHAGGKQRSRADRSVQVRLSAAVKANLGDIQTLAAFLESADPLTRQDRMTIIDQALLMIDQTYVHLPLKRAMHAVDPVQRLRLVERRLDNYTERAFHNEMISIFVHLRDLHTNYILPEPYRSRTAFLPFHIEECFEGAGLQKKSVFVVTEVAGVLSDPNFKPGVVVTHWNGIPIATAVDINADREAGSNLDARHLQGLQTMTNRWMGMSLPPDEEWVVIRYLPGTGTGPAREARFDWKVSLPPATAGGGVSVSGSARLSAGGANLARLGVDAKGEMLRRFRKLLFAPDAVSSEQKMADLGARAPAAAQAFHDAIIRATSMAEDAVPARERAGTMKLSAMAGRSLAPELGAAPRARMATARKASPRAVRSPRSDALEASAMLEGVDLTANSILPDVIKQFGKVTNEKGTFGYIRVVTFELDDVDTFISEFIRILALLPQDGLILDVRGNGGGTIAAGEGLLQTMTPREIEPERFHLINTPLTLQMCQQDPELAVWKKSAEESVEIGSAFTQGFPLTSPEFCNDIGQTYQGPVVLIVDAGCYSTTDMFAAGFQDHDIGYVLGTSGHTGAGGANVWDHTYLEQTLPPELSPFKAIPAGASFRVAIRRSTRVGLHSGEPLEDLGVVPKEIYPMTRNDLLNHNGDLIAYACGILAGMARQRLTTTSVKRNDGSLDITAITTNIQRVDVLLSGRTIHTVDVKDGSIAFTVAVPARPPQPAAGTGFLECRGFRNDQLVASTRLQF